ncbi:hypothetical protein GCM10009785_13920 [Brooklawnia cerclae]|uniref:Uncharacterized protein n=1 Tax=Brooklawnia cerclae TaxID=349934 RepID=A0ABX0SI05_9ACTN|nr:hypothetical protein [Brooklawnia cerclae]NIH58038.1 hypothetical protein [Brooklawnia cerclae]
MKLSTQDGADFITFRYDEIVREAGTQVRLDDVRQALIPEVAAMLADTPRDVDREAAHLVQNVLQGVRRKRANNLRKDLEWVIDSWTTTPELVPAGVEALLGHSYPLGTQSGDDKTLGLWTSDDLRESALNRYREAGDVMSAASEYDVIASDAIQKMRRVGAGYLNAVQPGLLA